VFSYHRQGADAQHQRLSGADWRAQWRCRHHSRGHRQLGIRLPPSARLVGHAVLCDLRPGSTPVLHATPILHPRDTMQLLDRSLGTAVAALACLLSTKHMSKRHCTMPCCCAQQVPALCATRRAPGSIPRVAVRLLHAGLHRRDARRAAGGPGAKCVTNSQRLPGGPGRQPVPLHGVPAHHRRVQGGGRWVLCLVCACEHAQCDESWGGLRDRVLCRCCCRSPLPGMWGVSTAVPAAGGFVRAAALTWLAAGLACNQVTLHSCIQPHCAGCVAHLTMSLEQKFGTYMHLRVCVYSPSLAARTLRTWASARPAASTNPPQPRSPTSPASCSPSR
jgi:hypothetical protein